MNSFPRTDGAQPSNVPFTTKGQIETYNGTSVNVVGPGIDGYVLTADSSQSSGLRFAANGTGTVVGPISSGLNAIARYSDTTGNVIKNSGVTIDNSNNVAFATGALSGVGLISTTAANRLGQPLTILTLPYLTNY